MYAGVPIIAPVRVRRASNMPELERPSIGIGADGSMATTIVGGPSLLAEPPERMRIEIGCTTADWPAFASGEFGGRRVEGAAPGADFSCTWRASPKSMTRTWR